MSKLLQRLTPTTLVGLIGVVISCATAFGLPLSQDQSNSILVFGGAISAVLVVHGTTGILSNLNPPTLTGLITGGIGVAVAFGAPITHAQSESVLELAGLLGALLLVHGGAHGAVTALRAPLPVPTDDELERIETFKGLVEQVPRSVPIPIHMKFTSGPSTKAEPARTAMSTTASGNIPRKHLGCLPAFRPPALKTFLEYATAARLKKAPAAVAVPKVALPMDNNDVEGDCTIAGVAHLIAAWDKLYGQHDRIPSPGMIRTIYRKLTGGEDTGLVEANVLSTWRKVGLFGHKIWGYAPVKITDIEAIKKAVAYYGGCYLGIVCPDSAQRQFEEGKPWTFEGEVGEDGHCIVALGYTKDGLLCSTWGGVALVTWGFLAHCLREAWVILPHQLVEAGKDTLALDLKQLEQDLAAA